MTKKIILASAISSALLAAAMPTQAQTFSEFAKEGDVIFELRARYEGVKEDSTLDDAVGMTTRARIGYETANYKGFKVLAEYDQVIVMQDEYNSLTENPDNINKAVIQDGQGGDFNRFQISYSHDLGSAVLGRQTISFDNGRFIGNEGWRQNERTFDAIRLDLSAIENLSLTYAYINQVNEINYDDNSDVNNHLLNLGYQTPVGKVVTYAYLLEDTDTDETVDTYGLRFSGDTSVADNVSVLYSLEYAGQAYNTGVSGDDDETSDYNLVEIGVNASNITFLAGMEKQSGDGADSFTTLYSSGHEFNGWADSVPAGANGLVDSYAELSTNLSGVELAAVYHDFSSDEDNDNLGDEVNLLISKDFDNNFSAGLKLAQYKAGDVGTDTDKIWLWAEAKF